MTTSGYRFLAVLDFEATCTDRKTPGQWDIALQEIIEVPVALVCLQDLRVTSAFNTFVRPVHQPVLTSFCTQLTSITQEQVDNSAPIGPVLDRLGAWFVAQGATPANTLAVTCGDWDLKSMWPRQVALTPGLSTPPWFRQWCNLKVVFTRHWPGRPSGMMGMLHALGIPHQGHHHRGADDVLNLCHIAIRLLRDGAQFDATWSAPQREKEQRRWITRRDQASTTLKAKRRARTRLPPALVDSVGQTLDETIRRCEAEVARCEALAAVFAPDAGC